MNNSSRKRQRAQSKSPSNITRAVQDGDYNNSFDGTLSSFFFLNDNSDNVRTNNNRNSRQKGGGPSTPGYGRLHRRVRLKKRKRKRYEVTKELPTTSLFELLFSSPEIGQNQIPKNNDDGGGNKSDTTDGTDSQETSTGVSRKTKYAKRMVTNKYDSPMRKVDRKRKPPPPPPTSSVARSPPGVSNHRTKELPSFRSRKTDRKPIIEKRKQQRGDLVVSKGKQEQRRRLRRSSLPLMKKVKLRSTAAAAVDGEADNDGTRADSEDSSFAPDDNDGASDDDDCDYKAEEEPVYFSPHEDDVYIIPELHTMVSYMWSKDPAFYRTGVVCSNGGLVRFYSRDEDGEEFVLNKKFHLNKKFFKSMHFRARPDLHVGSYCYDEESDRYCTLRKINIEKGGVVVRYRGQKKEELISADHLHASARPVLVGAGEAKAKSEHDKRPNVDEYEEEEEPRRSPRLSILRSSGNDSGRQGKITKQQQRQEKEQEQSQLQKRSETPRSSPQRRLSARQRQTRVSVPEQDPKMESKIMVPKRKASGKGYGARADLKGSYFSPDHDNESDDDDYEEEDEPRRSPRLSILRSRDNDSGRRGKTTKQQQQRQQKEQEQSQLQEKNETPRSSPQRRLSARKRQTRVSVPEQDPKMESKLMTPKRKAIGKSGRITTFREKGNEVRHSLDSSATEEDNDWPESPVSPPDRVGHSSEYPRQIDRKKSERIRGARGRPRNGSRKGHDRSHSRKEKKKNEPEHVAVNSSCARKSDSPLRTTTAESSDEVWTEIMAAAHIFQHEVNAYFQEKDLSNVEELFLEKWTSGVKKRMAEQNQYMIENMRLVQDQKCVLRQVTKRRDNIVKLKHRICQARAENQLLQARISSQRDEIATRNSANRFLCQLARLSERRKARTSF